MPNRDNTYKEGWPRITRKNKNFVPTYSSPPEGPPGVQAFRKGNYLTSSCKQKQLACPYRKKYLQCNPKAPACLHPFPGISRLKEHLYRCHMEPQNQCLRCRATFNSQASLERHLQATNICQPCQQPVSQVFGTDTQHILKKRKNGKSNEEKWAEIYQTLFPNDTDIPLPYHDELPLAEYREFAKEKLPNRLELALKALVMPHTGDPLLSESVISEVITIARTCNDDLVQEFQYEQQHQSSQDQSLELSTASSSPLVTFTNTPQASCQVEFMDGQQDTMPSGPIQQFTFANTAIPPTSESQSYHTGTTSGGYGNYPNVAMMNFNREIENMGMHAPASSQAWYKPDYGSRGHLATEESTSPMDAQVMQLSSTQPEDLIAAQNVSLPSTFRAMDATSFTTDIFLGTSQTTGPAFGEHWPGQNTFEGSF